MDGNKRAFIADVFGIKESEVPEMTECPSCASIRADLAAAIAAKEEAEAHAKRLEEYMLKGVAFRDELQTRIALLEKVVEAANKLIEHAMLVGCDCQGCVNMRAALRALPPPLQRGEERRREE
jgi:hypothetical protein